MRQYFLLILVSIAFHTTWAETSPPTISVITCNPGSRVYEVYGHACIRYKDEAKKQDVIYNYGLFDFSAPNFIWRYLRGQNTYLLGRESYDHFISRYQRSGQGVTEQVLNLTDTEVQELRRALNINAKRENREYLYNVFYDNCATRIYNIIEDQQDKPIIWNEECEDESFRSLMHQSNNDMPFSQMGIDLVFGIKADEIVTFKEQMFLPSKLNEGLALAKKGNGEDIVRSTQILNEQRVDPKSKEKLVFYLLLIAIILVSIWGRYKGGKFLKTIRIICYLSLGINSLVVFFISFFSIHPTVLPNINHIWMNPLWFVVAIIFMLNKDKAVYFTKFLNGWCIVMASMVLLSFTGMFYLHYGNIYTIANIVILSYSVTKLPSKAIV